jgi:hypothetical protein
MVLTGDVQPGLNQIYLPILCPLEFYTICCPMRTINLTKYIHLHRSLRKTP